MRDITHLSVFLILFNTDNNDRCVIHHMWIFVPTRSRCVAGVEVTFHTLCTLHMYISLHYLHINAHDKYLIQSIEVQCRMYSIDTSQKHMYVEMII